MEYVDTSSHMSATFTVKCGWWAGRKILKLIIKHNPLFAFRTEFNEVVFGIIGTDDDKKQEIYKLLLQNGAKEIRMAPGMSIL
jgi:hypothetical protein